MKALVLALAVAVAARIPGAWAAAPAEPAGPVVLIAVRGNDEDVTALRSVLEELLARIELEPRVTPGAPEGEETKDRPFATVLVDVTARNSASVAVQEGRSGQVRLLRQIEHVGSRPLLIDTVAHVIYAMLETMVRERLGRGDPPRAAPTEEPDRPAPLPLLVRTGAAPPSGVPASRWGFELSPFYAVRSFAVPDQRLMMNAGLAVSAGSRAGRLQPSLSLSATYGLDIDLGSGTGMPGQAFGRMQVISLHAIPVINVIGRGRLLLQAGIGGGLDVVRIETAAPPIMGPAGPMGPANVPAPPTQRRRFDPLIGAQLMARLALTGGTQLFVAGSADYGPSDPLQMGFGSAAPMPMSHWRLQGSLGLSVTLGGRPPGW